MQGRKPLPTALKLIKGNPGKRKLNKNEPGPTPALPSAPAHLKGAGLDEWGRVSRMLYEIGLLTALDKTALAAYCDSYSIYMEALDMLSSASLLIKTKDGNIINNPLIGIANTARKTMLKFMIEFGMTPSSRSRLSAKPACAVNRFDDLDDYS